MDPNIIAALIGGAAVVGAAFVTAAVARSSHRRDDAAVPEEPAELILGQPVVALRTKSYADLLVLRGTRAWRYSRDRGSSTYNSRREAVSQPVAVTAATADRSADHREFFAVLSRGSIRHRHDFGPDGAWSQLGGPSQIAVSAITAIVAAPPSIALYGLTPSGMLCRRQWPAESTGDWSDWVESETSPVAPLRALAGFCRWPGCEDLILLDADGQLWKAWCDPPGSPLTWEAFETRFEGPRSLAATSRQTEHCEAFVVDRDGGLWHSYRNPGDGGMNHWREFKFQSPEPGAAVTTASSGDHSQTLCVLGETGELFELRYWGDRWQTPWKRIV